MNQDDGEFIFGENCTYPSDEFASPRKTEDVYYSNNYGIFLL